MRRALVISKISVAAFLFGCQSYPDARPVSLASPRLDLVENALTRWPRPAPGTAIKRPFFATIHLGNRRITASGILQYYGPRDFRLTAATEVGGVLFDARLNWAGVTVLRVAPGLDKQVVSTLMADLPLAFDIPTDIRGLEEGTWNGEEEMILRRKMGDTHNYTWVFAARTGQLRRAEIELGIFDTLVVDYAGYTDRGWPAELVISREARSYSAAFSFTDNNVVQGKASLSAEESGGGGGATR